MMKKTKVVKFRMSEEEYNGLLLKSLYNKLNISKYIRKIIEKDGCNLHK
jgi:predicted DNA binding CopG/RHH family protein